MTERIEIRPILNCKDQIEGFTCDFGPLIRPNTASHQIAGVTCLHAVDPLPRVIEMSFQTVMRAGPDPCLHAVGLFWHAMISRRDDIVTLAYDQTDEIESCHRKPDGYMHRWLYRVHPARRWERTDEEAAWRETHGEMTSVVGVWVD